MCVCVCVKERERERDRDGEREIERERVCVCVCLITKIFATFNVSLVWLRITHIKNDLEFIIRSLINTTPGALTIKLFTAVINSVS